MPKRKYNSSIKTVVKKRRTHPPRHPWMRRKPSEITKLKRQVRKITKSIEHKSHYKYDSVSNITGNTEDRLETLGTFDMSTEVEGQKITASAHSFNMKIEYQAANDIVYSKWRIMVVLPKTEVNLIFADVLQSVSNEYLFQSGYKSQDIPDGKKYTVLMDKAFTLSNRNPLKIIKFRKSWKTGKVITLNDNGALTPSMATNDYRPQVLLYCMPNVNGTGSTAGVYCQSKLRFTDL